MFDNAIKQKIQELRSYSNEFMEFYAQNKMAEAKIVSSKAVTCFDYIGNEILRIRDNQKKNRCFTQQILKAY